MKLSEILNPPRCGARSEKGSTCTLRPGHIRRDFTAHRDDGGRTYDDDGLIQDHWPVPHHPSVPVCDKCLGHGLLSSTDGRCRATRDGRRCMFPEGHRHGHWWRAGDGLASSSWLEAAT